MSSENLTYWIGEHFYVNPCSRCNNSCIFCIRNFADGVYGFDLRLTKDPNPEQLADAVKRTWNNRFEEAVVVGFGEPLLNLEGTLQAVREIKLLSDVPVRINTNGQALIMYPERDVPAELKNAGIDRVQVSLNAPDSRTYEILCRPQLGLRAYDSVLEFVKRCAALFPLDISAVELPGIDTAAIERLAERIGAGFRLRRFYGPQSVASQIPKLLSQRS
jgi:cyclic pyranopterin phosphate synthase